MYQSSHATLSKETINHILKIDNLILLLANANNVIGLQQGLVTTLKGDKERSLGKLYRIKGNAYFAFK